ncbi:universal stress protein [Thiohalobacter thiocyanaticus]|uniref:Universal stress protein n=1 Tax=Thiohalobacter thiocyanaticus TaxID=585455 RepID=A0A426QKP5_9GAMM|nr:universal stress protein [Thiohalobacter thiocyanaticus]RRQ22329.1 universal stress protein [Thiohalobacter thiocyanaticus]
MSEYSHVLVAVDFMPDFEQVTRRAMQIAAHSQARLSLVHVVEFLHLDLASELVLPEDVTLETQVIDTARNKLAEMAASMDWPGEIKHHLETGSTKHEILRVAEEQAVDLLVIGSHGRHGLGRLLGSTANGVLQGAPCDVLAVRIQPA